MIKENIASAINDQIKEEFYSAYLYLALAAHYESANLLGFAAWLKQQAQEELTHAMKFYTFLMDREGTVTLQAVPEPPSDLPEPHKAFHLTYEHEQKITQRINDLVDLAQQEGDRAFEQFLQWFVAEQVEEEASTKKIVDTLELIGTDQTGLYMLDRELAQRGSQGEG